MSHYYLHVTIMIKFIAFPMSAHTGVIYWLKALMLFRICGADTTAAGLNLMARSGQCLSAKMHLISPEKKMICPKYPSSTGISSFLHQLILLNLTRLSLNPLQSGYEPTRSRDYLVKCNWALYVENYLEGFHIPYVHSSLNEVIDYGAYTDELYDYCCLQLGIAKPGEECFTLSEISPDYGSEIAAYYWWVFPNLMLNYYPWGLSINIVRPLAQDLTKVSFITYVSDHSKLDKGAGSGLDRVEREDEAIVEMVQRGMQSSFYSRGRYSPKRERGVHHFHRLLTEFLNNE